MHSCRNAIARFAAAIWLPILLTDAQSASAQVWATPKMQQQVDEVVTLLEGVMDTTAQATVNPKAPGVQMTTCRVQADFPAALKINTVLYQEQALIGKIDQPYRQRVLVIAASSNNDSVVSISSKLAEPTKWIGLCNRPESQRVLQIDQDLGEQVCMVYLQKSATGYIGETPPQGCPANIRGAVRITNTIELTPTGMNTWDRGFDATGQQVWGARSESYQFRRRE
ncbi:MAG: chromophore lyase CpcT/CpeT [Leptolyngbyaceae cyanobacterium bins.349]|nr:chromophore lyase CpcT/CpeT [Leptolyngbyaceae cyanobacterium bins.349]